MNDCPWKLFFDSNSPQTPSNSIPFDNSGNAKGLLHCFHLKLEQLSRKKGLKLALLGNCFQVCFNVFLER